MTDSPHRSVSPLADALYGLGAASKERAIFEVGGPHVWAKVMGRVEGVESLVQIGFPLRFEGLNRPHKFLIDRACSICSVLVVPEIKIVATPDDEWLMEWTPDSGAPIPFPEGEFFVWTPVL